MKNLIIGGDERFACLAGLLRQRGEAVSVYGRADVCGWPPADEAAAESVDRIIVNEPPRVERPGMDPGALLSRASAKARIYLCGPKHPEGQWDGRRVDLWADEALLRDNARLTAEGAVCAAMRSARFALRDADCLVIGWGRIARALTEALVGLGAHVTVASRSAIHRNQAIVRGAQTVSTGMLEAALPDARLVFSTAPAMVLDEAMLCYVARDAMLIDLASPPYGVNLYAAWNRGIRAWREPALPGRYCPESAARALLAAIDRAEGRREA